MLPFKQSTSITKNMCHTEVKKSPYTQTIQALEIPQKIFKSMDRFFNRICERCVIAMTHSK